MIEWRMFEWGVKFDIETKTPLDLKIGDTIFLSLWGVLGTIWMTAEVI